MLNFHYINVNNAICVEEYIEFSALNPFPLEGVVCSIKYPISLI